MGPTALRHWRNAEQTQYLHCLVFLSISTVTVIKPATFRSTVKRSTDFPRNTTIVGGKYTVKCSSFTFRGEYNKKTCKW